MPDEIKIDSWSPLSHKERIGQPGEPGIDLTPAWVPKDAARRLAGYDVLGAYLDNVGRLTLAADMPHLDRKRWREYGDPRTIVTRIVAAILGDDWAITVDGAGTDLADGPDLPPAPTPPAGQDPRRGQTGPMPDTAALEWRVYAARREAWDLLAADAFDRWTTALRAQPGLQRRQEELRAWADKIQLAARLHEAEPDAVGLGDAVYVLWRQDGGWPKIEVYHPGFYFPVLADDDRGEYPPTVHFCWEYEETDSLGQTRRRIRRLTFELVDLTWLRSIDGQWMGPDGEPTDTPHLAADEVVVDGRVRRRYPWTPDDVPDAELPTTMCLYSSGSWDLAAVASGSTPTRRSEVTALDESEARWDDYRVEQGCDFLPVVHVPDTPEGSAHFGRSVLLSVAQVLDDLAQTDTRTMDASQFLGAPAMAISGAAVRAGEQIPVTAGVALGLGENGSADMLDLSAGIQQLYALGDRLVDRLLANLGIPREVLGRVDESTSSGVHLLIKYLPWAQVIGALRLPRGPKYELLLKMAQRLAQVAGVLEPGPTPVARLEFGSFLPMDHKTAVELVAEAVGAHVMSRATGVLMLQAAGLPIEDARAELDRIEAEDTEGAVQLADALAGAPGAVEHVARRVGLEVPDAGAPPVVDL